MSAQITEEEALNKVASYCSSAEHCRAEINDKLQRWGIAYEAIARILSQLETEKYIDCCKGYSKIKRILPRFIWPGSGIG